MIPNKRPASEYRVRTLDRNDLNEKGKIYIGKGGTTTVDGVTGVYDIEAKNIITAINENATDKNIEANVLSGKNGIVSNGDIKSTKHNIMVVDTNGTPLAKMDGDGNITAKSFKGNADSATNAANTDFTNAEWSDYVESATIEEYGLYELYIQNVGQIFLDWQQNLRYFPPLINFLEIGSVVLDFYKPTYSDKTLKIYCVRVTFYDTSHTTEQKGTVNFKYRKIR